MVATIVRGQVLVGMLRIADHTIKIDHCIKIPVRADPLVHGLPVGLTQRARDGSMPSQQTA